MSLRGIALFRPPGVKVLLKLDAVFLEQMLLMLDLGLQFLELSEGEPIVSFFILQLVSDEGEREQQAEWSEIEWRSVME